jgi:mycothione reductase
VAPYPELPVWTSDSLFPLEGAPPNSLLVIGNGGIGCEMSAFLSGVGVETHLFARRGRLLGREDGDIEKVFQAEFGNHVHTHCHAVLTDLIYDGTVFTAIFDVHGKAETFTSVRVLFAIGRRPNTEDLQLEKPGLATNERGFLPVDGHLQTAVEGIYAAGDVNGRYMLQHAASFEVRYLRQKFLKGQVEPIDERLIGHAVFSHPEVASVGVTEEQLKDAGTPYVAIFKDWLASDRAMAMRVDYPWIKLLVSLADFPILGCHLVGPGSSTLLHQIIAVMHLKNNIRVLADMIYIQPELNECILAAAVNAVAKVRKYNQA